MADDFILADNEKVETLDNVPENLRKNYTPSDSGGFDLVTPEAKRLKSTVATLREQIAGFDKRQEEWETTQTSSAEQISELQSQLEALREERRGEDLGDRKDEFDRELASARASIEEDWAARFEALNGELASVREQHSALQLQTELSQLRSEFQQGFDSLTENPVHPDMRADLLEIAMNEFRHVDDNGQRYALDSEGEKMRGPDGELLQPSGWAKKQLEIRPKYFQWKNGTGPNARSSDASGASMAERLANASSMEEYKRLRAKATS